MLMKNQKILRKRLHGHCLSHYFNLLLRLSKRQTHREVGTQSHGSAIQMRTDIADRQTAESFFSAVFVIRKEVVGPDNDSVSEFHASYDQTIRGDVVYESKVV
jgi:hypothetical protein